MPVLPSYNKAASAIKVLLSGAQRGLSHLTSVCLKIEKEKEGKIDTFAPQHRSSLGPPRGAISPPPSSQLTLLSLVLVLSITRTSSIMHVSVSFLTLLSIIFCLLVSFSHVLLLLLRPSWASSAHLFIRGLRCPQRFSEHGEDVTLSS